MLALALMLSGYYHTLHKSFGAIALIEAMIGNVTHQLTMTFDTYLYEAIEAQA